MHADRKHEPNSSLEPIKGILSQVTKIPLPRVYKLNVINNCMYVTHLTWVHAWMSRQTLDTLATASVKGSVCL